MTQQIGWANVTLQPGKQLYVDGWDIFSRGLKPSEWEKAQFRLESRTGLWLAVNITLTGRTIQKKNGQSVVKCKIEFVGDGEPSTFNSGWVFID